MITAITVSPLQPQVLLLLLLSLQLLQNNYTFCCYYSITAKTPISIAIHTLTVITTTATNTTKAIIFMNTVDTQPAIFYYHYYYYFYNYNHL